jgi:hypothetical protein
LNGAVTTVSLVTASSFRDPFRNRPSFKGASRVFPDFRRCLKLRRTLAAGLAECAAYALRIVVGAAHGRTRLLVPGLIERTCTHGIEPEIIHQLPDPCVRFLLI